MRSEVLKLGRYNAQMVRILVELVRYFAYLWPFVLK